MTGVPSAYLALSRSYCGEILLDPPTAGPASHGSENLREYSPSSISDLLCGLRRCVPVVGPSFLLHAMKGLGQLLPSHLPVKSV